MRFVRLFQPRFAALVGTGAKCQTIRPVPKRMPKPGDTIDCRYWDGRPYRSKQKKLGEFKIVEVFGVTISRAVMSWRLRRGRGNFVGLDYQARADGFRNWEEMVDWFEVVHGLPFTGILIRWEKGEK